MGATRLLVNTWAGLLLAGSFLPLLGQDVVRPRGNWLEYSLVSCTAIEYPTKALEYRIGGKVHIEGVLNEHGRAKDLVAVSGHPLLVDAAKKAVRSWEFRPYAVRGVPVKAHFEITIRFSIDAEGRPSVRPCAPEDSSPVERT